MIWSVDFWQLVDAGYGKMFKTFMGQGDHNWSDDDERADRWYGNEELYLAK